MSRSVNLDEPDWQCPVCRDQYDLDDRKPMILTCGHSVCNSCVSSGQMRDRRTHTTKCPVCRALHVSPGASARNPEKVAENLTMKMLLGKMGINKRRRDEQKDVAEAPPSRVARTTRDNSHLMTCLQDILDGADLTDRERSFYSSFWRAAYQYVDTRFSYTLSDVILVTFRRPGPGVTEYNIRIPPEVRDQFCQDYKMLVGRNLVPTDDQDRNDPLKLEVVHPFLERSRLPEVPFEAIASDAFHQRIGTGCRVKRLDPNEKTGIVFVTSPSELDSVLCELQGMEIGNPRLMPDASKGGVYISYP